MQYDRLSATDRRKAAVCTNGTVSSLIVIANIVVALQNLLHCYDFVVYLWLDTSNNQD
jgi:hypothetical protein